MTRIFDKVTIVPKLNEQDAPLVQRVIKVISQAATASNPIIDITHTPDERTLIIAVGGDGTMLEAMRRAANHNSIATGVNLGHVGFLTDFTFYNTSEGELNLFNELLMLFHDSESYPTEQRTSLQCAIGDGLFKNVVFNEFVLSNLFSDGIIKYHLEIDNVDAGYHKANGIVIGTPTGSTAYTLSNGGGLILPSMNVMQIVPTAPLSMSSRPIIVPSESTVQITVETKGTWCLKGDGETISTFDTVGPVVRITQIPTKTRILHSKTWNFFEMLTTKLHWKQS